MVGLVATVPIGVEVGDVVSFRNDYLILVAIIGAGSNVGAGLYEEVNVTDANWFSPGDANE